MIRPAHLLIAHRELGIEEPDKRIIEYWEAIRHGYVPLNLSTNTPWCGAFTNWVLNKNGIKGTETPDAKSFLTWAEELPSFRRGCIVVLKMETGWHVGFGSSQIPLLTTVLGGNQADSVKYSRFYTRRVASYRWHPKFNDLL